MDQRGCGLVRRSDFYEATTEHVTLEMRRTITRGDLHQRFRFNAAEMTLQELVGLVWPNANERDQKQMSQWAKLRDASSVLLDSSFKGTRADLKRIFDLLDEDGSETLSIGELVRARILTKCESKNLLDKWYRAFKRESDDSCSESGSESGKKEVLSLSFNEFCVMTQKHLCEKYAQKDDSKSWDVHCRSAFKTSKATAASLLAARENFESSLNQGLSRDSPEKVSLKTAAYATIACKELEENAGIVMAC